MVLAVLLLGLLAVAVAGRVAYPYELEWMEGATVVHLARLLAGDGIYVPPTLDFVPFAYPPLYYYACLPAAWVLGAGFDALRIVSIAATIITLAAIVAVVRRESGAAAGIIAAGAYAGAYPLSDGWYDLGRVDALYVAWLALAWLAASRASRPAHWCLCGALAAAAFTTKQPAALAMAPLALLLLVRNWRAALWFGGTFAVVSGAVILLLQARTDGWYIYYVFELPRLRVAASSRADRALTFWTADTAPFAIAVVSGVTAAILSRSWRHLALAGGLIGAAWLARLEGGAWTNAVMPAWLALAILLGISLRRDLRWPVVRWTLAAAQLALLLYDPRAFVPTPAHTAQGAAFVEALRVMPRPVLVMDHGYWSTLAALPEHAHGWAVTDVVWADRATAGPLLESEVQAAIREGRFATILVDGGRSWFRQDLEEHYAPRGRVEAPEPLSGAPRRPALALGTR